MGINLAERFGWVRIVVRPNSGANPRWPCKKIDREAIFSIFMHNSHRIVMLATAREGDQCGLAMTNCRDEMREGRGRRIGIQWRPPPEGGDTGALRAASYKSWDVPRR